MTAANVTRLHNPAPSDIKFNIGRRLDGAQMHVEHSMQQAPNFHLAVIGTSGSGKTFTIRRLAIELASQGVTQFILDTQGDYAAAEFRSGHDTKGVRINELKFGYGAGTCGINPFVIHQSDQGGYHHAVIGVLETIRLFNPAMGARQKTLLRRLINTAYARKGIVRDNPHSWGAPPPVMADLLSVINDEMSALKTGATTDIFDEISALRKNAASIVRQMEGDKEVSDSVLDSMKVDLAESKEKLHTKLFEFLEAEIDSGEKPPSVTGALTRLESIQDMIEGVVTSGLFDGDPITPKRGAINVLDLTSLNAVDQQPVFFLLLEPVFHSAVRTCKHLNPKNPDMIFTFDEVKLFTALADSPLDPINRFFTEGRKYGLGSMCGLQHPKQLTEEMRASIGTILLLPLAKEKISDAKRLWGIPEEQMARLRSKSDGLYGLGNNPFLPIKLFG